jgi:hypothetical protein
MTLSGRAAARLLPWVFGVSIVPRYIRRSAVREVSLMSCHAIERFLVGLVVRNHDVDGLFPDDHIGRDVQCVADLQASNRRWTPSPPRDCRGRLLSRSFPASVRLSGVQVPPRPLRMTTCSGAEESEVPEFLPGMVTGLRVEF